MDEHTNHLCLLTLKKCVVFTALHEIQTRSSDENSVRPSVRPSVCLSNACIVTVSHYRNNLYLSKTREGGAGDHAYDMLKNIIFLKFSRRNNNTRRNL